jgi:D-alanine-D-alanine ligase
VTRLRVGVIYGGRSGEHEVSVASAASVLANLDHARYEPVPIRIVAIERENRDTAAGEDAVRALVTGHGLDVVFPVLHGPYGEDGTVQGLLELANVAYVGAGVLASALAMDKAVAKVVFAARGLPVPEHVLVTARAWAADREACLRDALSRFPLPVFVKPANLGSSVGISKAHTRDELAAAIDLAATFDRKILVEEAVPAAREIECAVLGNASPDASVPGEILPSREFYDYEAKYLDAGSQLLIPAPLAPDETDRIRRLSLEAFRAIDCAGMARVDFLVARDSGAVFLNEINTIPGFTTISMYPKLWEASGLAYPALVDRLIELALERHAEKQQLRTSAG